jgi:eukaryotic-like serine/threonine-protein kinase
MTRARNAATSDPALCGARYRICGRIATGGMAEVLDGHDTVLGRPVAIKVLKPVPREEEVPEDDAGAAEADAAHAADRMRVEAQALALLPHRNIVAAFDFGVTTDGRPFIVTERLMGRALNAELVERTFLPWPEAVSIVLAVLAALEAVHAKGIVHRDVKPGNVFLCADGSVKLLDFGVAKILGEASVKHLAPAYRTKEGSLVGTPKYVTPEQAFGHAVDARTDVYAVGLLLYGLVTGRHAFADEGDFIRVVEAMRDDGAPPPSKVAPQPIPPELDAAVSKALAWSPAQRFQSAGSFARALRAIPGAASEETFPEELDEPTRALAPERRLSPAAFVVVVAAAAALVFGALVLLAGGGG